MTTPVVPPPNGQASSPTPTSLAAFLGQIALALLATWLLSSFVFGILRLALHVERPLVFAVAAGIVVLVSSLVLTLRGHTAIVWRFVEAFVIVVLPLWGAFINHGLSSQCEACAGDPSRAIAEPDIYGIYLLYGLALLGYAIMRRRSERLRPLTELLAVASVGSGILLCALLALHFNGMAILGVMFSWAGLPLAAPIAVGLLFLNTLLRRLSRHGLEVAEGGLAEGELAEKGKDVGARFPMLAGAPLLLGLWSIGQRLFVGRWPHEAFTQVCADDWLLGMLQTPVQDCHYLCTVAAGGHRWLVRPERKGWRRGHPILVNRQLAIANAFEDLLHQRWPAFGRACRGLYDRTGLPISRYIRSRWLADAMYLAMKPAEWCFAIFLLLFDRENPEQRLSRMYRSPSIAPDDL